MILACDLVSRNEWRELNRKSPTLEELSDLLRAADIHPRVGRPEVFRSVSSVRRKIADIASQHPSYTGKPTRGGPHDLPVLLEFIKNTSQMQAETTRIREALRASGRMLPIELDVDHQTLEAEEGKSSSSSTCDVSAAEHFALPSSLQCVPKVSLSRVRCADSTSH